jgi:hypothetical protein
MTEKNTIISLVLALGLMCAQPLQAATEAYRRPPCNHV